MSRIELTDTAQSAIVKMSEGNPGAMISMFEIVKDHDAIDPQAMFGGLGAIMMLDTWEIYGSDIYILFNDKCDRSVRKMLVLMRACQLGFLSHSKIKQMAKDQSMSVDLSGEEWSDIDQKVCERLEDFAKPDSPEQTSEDQAVEIK